MKTAELNLIPRVVPGKEHHFPANLWALACALNDLGDKAQLYFSMEEYGPSLKDPSQPYHSCGTPACAIGFGRLLRIGDGSAGPIPQFRGDYAYYAKNHLWNGFITEEFESEDELNLERSVCAWMFGGLWTDIDNTPRGAAARIAFVLCHPEVFLPEENVEDLCYRLRLHGGLFTRWQAAFDWAVIPEIPGAEAAADKARESALEWLNEVVNGIFTGPRKWTAPPEQADE